MTDLEARLDTLHEERARVLMHLDLVERRIASVARELRGGGWERVE